MAKRRKPRPDSERSRSRLRLKRIAGADDAWELALPPCAEERADDLDEVRAMIEAGEFEIAVDELRWLLDGCGDLLEAHRLLGEIAFEQGDVPLARGHFGYAYRIVLKALPAEFRGTLPAANPANRTFYEAALGLLECLWQRDKREMADDVVAQLKRLDPSDPLRLDRAAPGSGPRPEGPDVYELKP